MYIYICCLTLFKADFYTKTHSMFFYLELLTLENHVHSLTVCPNILCIIAWILTNINIKKISYIKAKIENSIIA